MDTSVRAASANFTAGAAPAAGIPPKSYALSGKIMLSTIASLLAVVLLVLCLHIYSRWHFSRLARRRRLARALARRDAAGAAAGGGLDPGFVASLPLFTYSPAADEGQGKASPPPPECAVCLCEFEERDQGRVLPPCGHAFHADCIAMWLASHSTCPLCRAPVKPDGPARATGCCGAQGGGEPAGAPSAPRPALTTAASPPGCPGSTAGDAVARCLPNLDFRITREGAAAVIRDPDLERGEVAVAEQSSSTTNSSTRSKTRSSS